MARDVDALRGASPGPDDFAAGDAFGSGPDPSRLTAPAGSRKRIGLGRRFLRGLGALVAVLVVGVALGGILLYQRLEQGPLSLQPLVPWLEGPIEQRLGQPVDIQGLRIAWADASGEGAGDGLVLDAGPVAIGGDAPARADMLRLWVGLPFRLQAAELRVTETDARTLLAVWPTRLAPEARTLLAGMILAGRIRTGELRYRFNTNGPDELGLQVAAENGVVQLPNGLPKVSAPSAHVTIENGALQISAPRASGADLEARSVDVSIDHFVDDAPSRMNLAGQVQGQAGALYRLLADPPLALIPGDLVDQHSARPSERPAEARPAIDRHDTPGRGRAGGGWYVPGPVRPGAPAQADRTRRGQWPDFDEGRCHPSRRQGPAVRHTDFGGAARPLAG